MLQKALKRSHATCRRNLKALLAAYRVANLETGRTGLFFDQASGSSARSRKGGSSLLAQILTT